MNCQFLRLDLVCNRSKENQLSLIGPLAKDTWVDVCLINGKLNILEQELA